MSSVEDRSELFYQLVSRAKMFIAGVTHGGMRDLYALFGWKRSILQSDHAARYIRQEIAKRIIDAPIQSTWCDPPDLEANNPEFQAAWETLLVDSPIFSSIIRLDKLAGLGRYAVMVLGFDDGKDLQSAVEQRHGNAKSFRKLLYLQPYAEMAVSVEKYDEDKQSPRFGKPLIYKIAPGRFEPQYKVGGYSSSYEKHQNRPPFLVHHTRVLHVAENLLEDGNYGRSRLECITNTLDDLLKVSGGSAEMFWLTANRGMQADVDKDMELDPEDAENLSKEIDEYHHDMRRFIRTRGVKISELGKGGTTDPRGTFDILIDLLCAGTGYPRMIFLGTARGNMASQQDRANWADRIAERITEYAEPVVFKPLINMLVFAGVLPQPINLKINWQEAYKLSPLERAQTSAQMARSAANLTKTFKDLSTQTSVDPLTGAQTTTSDAEPLFSREEMRRIVGFGKRAPVFDRSTNSPSNPTSPGETSNVNDPAA